MLSNSSNIFRNFPGSFWNNIKDYYYDVCRKGLCQQRTICNKSCYFDRWKKGFLWAWYFWFTANSCPLSFNRPLIPEFRLSLLFVINEKGQIIQFINVIPKRKLTVTNFDNNSFETLTKHNRYNRGTIWRSFSLCVHCSGTPFSYQFKRGPR